MALFQDAISAAVRQGDVVLDAGAGTGIMSVLAARSGAKMVYAVELDPVISLGESLASENSCEDRIVFIRGDVTDVELPEKADGAICEMIGLAGLSEGIRGIMAEVRRKHLKPGAWTIPSLLRIVAAPVSDEALYNKIMLTSAADVSTRSLHDEIANNYWVEDLCGAKLAAAPLPVLEIDIAGGSDKPSSGVVFELDGPGEIHGLAVWFEAELAPGIVLNTSPVCPQTHWLHGFFPFRTPVSAAAGGRLKVGLTGIPMKKGEMFHWCAEYKDGDGRVICFAQSNALAAMSAGASKHAI